MRYIALEADEDAQRTSLSPPSGSKYAYETSDGSRAVLHTGCIFEVSILGVKLRPMRLCSLPNDGIRHGEFVAHRCDGSQAQAQKKEAFGPSAMYSGHPQESTTFMRCALAHPLRRWARLC